MGRLCFVSKAVRSHVPFIIVSAQIYTALTLEPFLVQFSNYSATILRSTWYGVSTLCVILGLT